MAVVGIEHYIAWFYILMNNFVFVKISDGRQYLSTNLLNPLNHEGSTLLLQIDFHIIPFLEIHNHVEIMITGLFVICSHKIFVFNYIRMNKVLGNNELTEHFFHCLYGQFWIIEDFACFINKTTFESLQSTFENFSL